MEVIAILDSLKDIAIFAAVLSVLIIVHEWGHFITAKKLGVKVERFALGFGKKLFSWKQDGTEFMVCLIPLGGYVKMAGDERAECRGTKDEFYSKSPGHRGLIILNGPIINFVLAYICLFFVFILGYPDLSPKVGELMDDYPAKAAGVMLGDKIIEIDSRNVETWTDIQRNIALSKKDNISVVVVREGNEVEINITPRLENIKNVFGQVQELRIIGIRPTDEIVILKYSFLESFGKSFWKLWEIITLTYKAIYRMAIGAMSAKENMTGPIGIFFIVKAAAKMGFSHVLYILGVISASLAIFNLLPFIPLDGGHLLLLGIEKIRGRALSPKVDEAVARFGFGLIICLALFVFYSDFARFGWIEAIQKLWSN